MSGCEWACTCEHTSDAATICSGATSHSGEGLTHVDVAPAERALLVGSTRRGPCALPRWRQVLGQKWS
jgi:hypothetical protein